MPLPNFTDEELDGIVKDVEKTLREATNKEQNDLAKAHEETPGEGHPAGEESSPVPPDASASSPDASAAPAAEAPASPDASAPPADASATPPADVPGEDAQGSGEAPTPEELEQAYSELPPEELKAHFLAIKSVIEKMMGAQQGSEPAGAAAPQAAPMAPPAGPPAGAPPAMKKELDCGDGCGGEIKVAKSEMDALRAEIETLKKSSENREELLGKLEAGLAKFAAFRPTQKAVTGIGQLAKSGNEVSDEEILKLTKTEATKKLSKVAASTSLSKSERELINQFTVGAVKIDAVKELLKKA